MNKRRSAALLAMLLCPAWSCGDAPSSPGNNSLPLAEGRYSVTLIGFDLTADPRGRCSR